MMKRSDNYHLHMKSSEVSTFNLIFKNLDLKIKHPTTVN